MKFINALILAIALGGATAAAATAPQARVDSGKLAGSADAGVERYLGIPFAAPPIGDLRWRAPKPAAHWVGIRQATAYGNDCMQNQLSGTTWKPQPTSEDCLYLNVWKPAGASDAKLPVMVWIFGGGFANGAGSWPIYDGTKFAERGIVLVTFNYRLNHFGFFAHPALMDQQKSEPVGNYGLMDQVAALQWVKRNVHAFGGDPANVTIFGESAGGHSANVLLTIPAANGLFAKALVESGGSAAKQPTRRIDQPTVGMMGLTPSELDADSQYIAGLGVTNPTAAALRALPAAQVLGGASMNSGGGGGPMVDGTFIVEDPMAVFAGGRQAHVPYIAGANSYEASIIPEMAKAAMWQAQIPIHDKVAAVYDGYGTKNPELIRDQYIGDSFMRSGARNAVQHMSAIGSPTWLYQFDHVIPAMQAKVPGTPHGGEMGFVFGTHHVLPYPSLPGDDALSAAVMGYWVNFAKTGDPNGAGLPRWPAYSKDSDALMLFTNDGPVAKNGWRKQQLDFADQISAAAQH